MTVKELSQYIKDNQLYVEVFADGSWEAEKEDHNGWFADVSSGDSLLDFIANTEKVINE